MWSGRKKSLWGLFETVTTVSRSLQFIQQEFQMVRTTTANTWQPEESHAELVAGDEWHINDTSD